MKPIEAVIVDDEKPACERLEKLLMSIPEIQVSGCFTSSSKATDYVIKTSRDWFFWMLKWIRMYLLLML